MIKIDLDNTKEISNKKPMIYEKNKNKSQNIFETNRDKKFNNEKIKSIKNKDINDKNELRLDSKDYFKIKKVPHKKKKCCHHCIIL